MNGRVIDRQRCGLLGENRIEQLGRGRLQTGYKSDPGHASGYAWDATYSLALAPTPSAPQARLSVLRCYTARCVCSIYCGICNYAPHIASPLPSAFFL